MARRQGKAEGMTACGVYGAPAGRFSSWYSYFLFSTDLYQGLKRAGVTSAAPAGQHTALSLLAISQERAALAA